MHSIYSPMESKVQRGLLRHAIDCNLSMMALTDHDEINGIKACAYRSGDQLDPEKPLKLLMVVSS